MATRTTTKARAAQANPPRGPRGSAQNRQRRATPAPGRAGHDAEREAVRAGLRRAVKREQEIQKLTRQLPLLVAKTHDRLDALACLIMGKVTENGKPLPANVERETAGTRE